MTNTESRAPADAASLPASSPLPVEGAATAPAGDASPRTPAAAGRGDLSALYAALAEFHQMQVSIPRSGKNDHLKSTYSTMGDVRKAFAALGSCGLTVFHHFVAIDGKNYLRGVLAHKDGASITSDYPISTEGVQAKGNQAVGSAVTYARRYTTECLLGLAGVDDDGEAADHAVGKFLRGKEAVEVIEEVIKDMDDSDALSSVHHIWTTFQRDYRARVSHNRMYAVEESYHRRVEEIEAAIAQEEAENMDQDFARTMAE